MKASRITVDNLFIYFYIFNIYIFDYYIIILYYNYYSYYSYSYYIIIYIYFGFFTLDCCVNVLCCMTLWSIMEGAGL